MTVKSRTIDHLGIESSSRYARDKAQLDTKIIEESRFIPQKAEISVLKPYLPAEFEEYLVPSQHGWASFAPPPEFITYRQALFSYQLVPSLGSYEKQEADANRLEALGDALQKESKGGEEERKRKALLHFLKVLGKLDRSLSHINACRNQYQKG